MPNYSRDINIIAVTWDFEMCYSVLYKTEFYYAILSKTWI